MTPETKSYQILCPVIAQPAPWLHVMDLRIIRASAELAMPSVPREDFTAELTIGLRIELQTWPFGSNFSQGTPCTLSKSRSRCAIGMPSTSRVRAERSASWLPVSKFTPARKFAQIIRTAKMSARMARQGATRTRIRARAGAFLGLRHFEN